MPTNIQPPKPGSGEIAVDCSAWLDEGDAVTRQWIVRGLAGNRDVVTIEITVSANRIVTLVVDPLNVATATGIRAQLSVDGQAASPFVTLQHQPVAKRPRGRALAPVDMPGLRVLLDALAQCAPMTLTLAAGDRELLEVPLHNDPSFEMAFTRMASR